MSRPKELALGLVVVAMLAGCAASPPKPVQVALKRPVKVQPEFVPGCLLPDRLVDASAHIRSAYLKVIVSPQGEISDLSVLISSGSTEHDDQVMQAVKLCKFVPGTLDGVPIESYYRYDHDWVTGRAPTGLMRCTMGAYPKASRELGEEGRVTVKMLRHADDTVEVSILRSSGYPRLDQQTLVAAQRCFEQPSVKADLPVEQVIAQTIEWGL